MSHGNTETNTRTEGSEQASSRSEESSKESSLGDLTKQVLTRLNSSRSHIKSLSLGDTTDQQRTSLLTAFRATFSTDHGRTVLGVLALSTHHGTPSFHSPTAAPIDPYAAAYRDGRKSVIDEILNHLAHPEDKPTSGPKAKR